MSRDQTPVPSGTARKTCGPSIKIPSWVWAPVPASFRQPASPDLAHFQAERKAAQSGKSVVRGLSCALAELFDEKVDKGPDARRAVAARHRQCVDRKRLRHLAVLQQRHQTAFHEGARDHEVLQSRDAETGD